VPTTQLISSGRFRIRRRIALMVLADFGNTQYNERKTAIPSLWRGLGRAAFQSGLPTLGPLISFQASNASVQRPESSSVRCSALLGLPSAATRSGTT
jgi:hypothetical protein